jgi:hypothetical protein
MFSNKTTQNWVPLEFAMVVEELVPWSLKIAKINFYIFLGCHCRHPFFMVSFKQNIILLKKIKQ